jgi:hypothetical protein
MRRVSRKPFDVMVDGAPAEKVRSPEEYEEFLGNIDRKKYRVRLV